MRLLKLLKINKIQKGKAGTSLLFPILLLVVSAGFLLVGGTVPEAVQRQPSDERVAIIPAISEAAKGNIQLYTFQGATLTPTPPPAPPPQGNECQSNPFNEEPDIFLGSDPPAAGVAKPGGQIKIWIDDGNGGSVAPGEKIDAKSGQIVTPGDRQANDGKGPNYYLWEPALYLTQLSSPTQAGPFSGDVENGGQPRFPTIIKGEVSYADTDKAIKLPAIDPPMNVVQNRSGHGGKIAQFVWDVAALNLAPGYYRVQMVVHDGDGDLAVNCTTIQI